MEHGGVARLGTTHLRPGADPFRQDRQRRHPRRGRGSGLRARDLHARRHHQSDPLLARMRREGPRPRRIVRQSRAGNHAHLRSRRRRGERSGNAAQHALDAIAGLRRSGRRDAPRADHGRDRRHGKRLQQPGVGRERHHVRAGHAVRCGHRGPHHQRLLPLEPVAGGRAGGRRPDPQVHAGTRDGPLGRDVERPAPRRSTPERIGMVRREERVQHPRRSEREGPHEPEPLRPATDRPETHGAARRHRVRAVQATP